MCNNKYKLFIYILYQTHFIAKLCVHRIEEILPDARIKNKFNTQIRNEWNAFVKNNVILTSNMPTLLKINLGIHCETTGSKVAEFLPFC